MFKAEDKKGFTLVELLAVIVILGVIMIIATPSVLDAMQSARIKSLEEYAQKVRTSGEKTYFMKKEFEGLKSPGSADIQLYVYDIKNDLDLVNTGDYKGLFIMFKFDNSLFEKLPLDQDPDEKVEPNTPYYGVILEDNSNILVRLSMNVEGLGGDTIVSIDELKSQYEELKRQKPDLPYSILDLYLKGFEGKEQLFEAFTEIFSYFNEEFSKNGTTLEQLEDMIPDDKAIKFMIVDGDTNDEFYSTKLASLMLMDTSELFPEEGSGETPK